MTPKQIKTVYTERIGCKAMTQNPLEIALDEGRGCKAMTPKQIKTVYTERIGCKAMISNPLEIAHAERIMRSRSTSMLIDIIKQLGASEAAAVSPSDIPFDPAVRKACEDNVCGTYGASWICPPVVGTVEQLEAQVRSFDTAILFSQISPISGVFDWTGMIAGGRELTKFLARIRDRAAQVGLLTSSTRFPQAGSDRTVQIGLQPSSTRIPQAGSDRAAQVGLPRSLFLGSGVCNECNTCTYPDSPCLFPDLMFTPIEACGIDVGLLARGCGLRYNNGADTVTFFGMVLFDEIDLEGARI